MQIKYIASGLIAMASSGALAVPVAAPEPAALPEPVEQATQDWDDWHDHWNDWRDEKVKARDLDELDLDRRAAFMEGVEAANGRLTRRAEQAEQAEQWRWQPNSWQWNNRAFVNNRHRGRRGNNWNNRFVNRWGW